MADLRSYFQGFDLDTGGGTDYVLGVNLRLSASGGSAEALGQKAMASSLPVVIANDQSAITVTTSGAVDTELPTAAALADNASNPTTPTIGAALLGFDGTAWDRIYTIADGDTVASGTKGFLTFGTDGSNYQALSTNASGRLQVDIISGAGESTPTNPVVSYQTSAALAAGSTASLTTPEATSKKLRMVCLWSSVAFKAAIHTVNNATESTDPVAVVGAESMGTVCWNSPHRNYVTLGATAGLDAFRAKVTNLDDSNAADVYATFYYED